MGEWIVDLDRLKNMPGDELTALVIELDEEELDELWKHLSIEQVDVLLGNLRLYRDALEEEMVRRGDNPWDSDSVSR